MHSPSAYSLAVGYRCAAIHRVRFAYGSVKMTISVEELVVLLVVLRTGKPFVSAAKDRLSKAIGRLQPSKNTNNRSSTRLRVRVVDISIELPR